MIEIRRLAALSVRDIAELSEVLVDCVEGGASVSFLTPLSLAKAEAFWRTVALGVQRHERVVLAAFDASGRIVGTVQVVCDQPENQPHRADVAKMLVHRRARRQGVGAHLLDAAEAYAHGAGKTLLVLDTVTGGSGYRLYERRGWQRCGDIPGYALWPDGTLCATTIFFKVLAAQGAREQPGSPDGQHDIGQGQTEQQP